MNGLIVVLAAAVAALLYRRPHTLKDDAAKVTNTAKEKATDLKDRVRGSGEEETVDDDTVLDLDAEGEESGAEDADTGASASAAPATD